MKLLRHFLAVSLVIGLVVALGFVWSKSGAASIVADDRGGGLSSPVEPGTSSAVVRQFDQRGAGGFSLSNISDLAQTLVVLTGITAAVVVIDRARRRHQPARFPARRPSKV